MEIKNDHWGRFSMIIFWKIYSPLLKGGYNAGLSSQLPNPPCPKEGFNLFPNPFPLQGKGLTAPTRRSFIKVLLP